jgi:hypothetical protein
MPHAQSYSSTQESYYKEPTSVQVTEIPGRYINASKLKNLLNDRFGDGYSVEVSFTTSLSSPHGHSQHSRVSADSHSLVALVLYGSYLRTPWERAYSDHNRYVTVGAQSLLRINCLVGKLPVAAKT